MRIPNPSFILVILVYVLCGSLTRSQSTPAVINFPVENANLFPLYPGKIIDTAIEFTSLQSGEEIFFFEFIPHLIRSTSSFSFSNISVKIQFCTPCGKWKLLYRKNFLPNFIAHAAMDEMNHTGSILEPVTGYVNFTVDPQDYVTAVGLPANHSRHFIGFHFQAAGCAISIGAKNLTNSKNEQLPPRPGNDGKLSVKMDSDVVTIDFTAALDIIAQARLEYRPYIQSILFGSGSAVNWCLWNNVPGLDLWYPNRTHFSFPVDQYSETFVKVRVRNPDNWLFSDYEVRQLPKGTRENIAQTIGEVFLVFAVLIPVVILYGGYARSFVESKFLELQPIEIQEYRAGLTPREIPPKEEVQLADEIDDEVVNLDEDASSDGKKDKSDPVLTPSVPISADDIGTEVNDLVLLKARKHASRLIVAQVVTLFISAGASFIVSGISLASMAIPAMQIPLFVFAITAIWRNHSKTLISYMVAMFWFTGFNITMMIFKINFGSDIINTLLFTPTYVNAMSSLSEPIISFVIDLSFITISIILFLVSLSPLSFIFIKANEFFHQNLITTTWNERFIMLFTGLAVVFPLTSNALIFHYLPTVNSNYDWSDMLRLFADCHFEIGLSLLGLTGALAAVCRNPSYCLIAMVTQPIHIFVSLVFGITNISLDNIPLYGQSDLIIVKNAVIALRWSAILLELLIFWLLALYWRWLHKEPLRAIARSFLPKSWGDLTGHCRVFTILMSLTLAVIAVIFVAHEITSAAYTFPPLFLALYFLALVIPASLTAVVFAANMFLIFTLLLDLVGILLLYYATVPGFYLILAIVVLLKEIGIIGIVLTNKWRGEDEDSPASNELLNAEIAMGFRDDREVPLEDAVSPSKSRFVIEDTDSDLDDTLVEDEKTNNEL